MRIELREIPIRAVAEGYRDSAENGVTGYGGRLNIRPAFQREFIYKDKQRDEVIRTVTRGFPLNVMYWVDSGGGRFDPKQLETRIAELMEDDDVTKKFGVYAYLLDGQERHLSLRAFTPRMKRAAYERQKGICARCGKPFELEAMQADHITPWSKGGRTVSENCQMLCADCNRRKSDI